MAFTMICLLVSHFVGGVRWNDMAISEEAKINI